MTSRRPIVGDPAPLVEFLDPRGQPWALADRRGTTVVLIFHRHIH